MACRGVKEELIEQMNRGNTLGRDWRAHLQVTLEWWVSLSNTLSPGHTVLEALGRGRAEQDCFTDHNKNTEDTFYMFGV